MAIKIAMDLQACQSEGSATRGIGRYSLALAKALKRNIADKEAITYLLNSNFEDEDSNLKKQLGNKNIEYYHYPVSRFPYGIPEDFMRPIAEKLILQKFNNVHSDVIYVPSIFEGGEKGLVPNFTGALKNKIVAATIHDLIPLVMSEHYLENPIVKKWYYQCLKKLQSCDILFSVSEATRQDAIKYLNISPDKIITNAASVDSIFRIEKVENKEHLLSKYNISKPFLMYTGGLDYRKNVDGLIKGYAKIDYEVRSYTQLVIVCSIKDHEKVSLLKLAKEVGLAKDEVVFTGFVPDDDLIKLYNICKLYIFPSKYEGFGLPILEAMRCGAPVIAANNSSIVEVMANDDATFNANNYEEMANTIIKGLNDNNFRNYLMNWSKKRSKDFSWDKTAQIAIESLNDIVKKSNKNQYTINYESKRKIAYIVCYPITNINNNNTTNNKQPLEYNEFVLKLNKYFDIDIYTNLEVQDKLKTLSDFNVLKLDDFMVRINDYDVVLYQINNDNDLEILKKLLLCYPGILVVNNKKYTKIDKKILYSTLGLIYMSQDVKCLFEKKCSCLQTKSNIYINSSTELNLLVKKNAEFINELICNTKNYNKMEFIQYVSKKIAGMSYSKQDILDISIAYSKNI